MADKKRILHLDIYDYSGNKLCPIYDNYVDIPGQATNVFITTERNGWRELSFELPTVVQYDDGNKENIIVSYLKADFLIRSIEDDTDLSDPDDAIDWFLISEPKISHNAYAKTISVTAGNASQLLKNKNLGLEFSDTEGNNIGTCEQLLDTILEGTDWSKGYVYPFADKDGSTKYRSLKASSKTGCFKLITMMCELFDAKPVFRTNRHKVDIYPINPFHNVKEGEIPDYAKKNGTIELYYGTNVKSITRTQNTENIRTKLYAYGAYGDKTFGYCDISESVHTEYTFWVNFDLIAGDKYYFRVEDLDGIMVHFLFTPTENITAGRRIIFSLLDPASMSYVWVESETDDEDGIAFFVEQGMSGTLLFDMNHRDNNENKSYVTLYKEYKDLVKERKTFKDADALAYIDSQIAEVSAKLPLSADGSYLNVDHAKVEVDYAVENMFGYIMDFDYYISVGLLNQDILQNVASFQRNARKYYERVQKASSEMSEARSKLSDLIGVVPYCKLKIKRADWTISDYLTLFLDYGEITHPDSESSEPGSAATQVQYPRGVIYRTDYDVTNDSYFRWITTDSLDANGDPINSGCSVLYIFHKATSTKPLSWDKYYLKAVLDDQVEPKAIQLWVSYGEAMKTIDIENDDFYLFQTNGLSGYIGSNEALDEAAVENLENATTIATVPHVTIFTDEIPSSVVIPSGQGGNIINTSKIVSFPMYHWLWCYDPKATKKTSPDSNPDVVPVDPTSDEISSKLSNSSDEWVRRVASAAWNTLCMVEGYTLEDLITYSSQWSKVDLGSRHKVSSEKMQAAGWTDFEDDAYATLYSSSRGVGTNAHPFTVVATPILPNGIVLSPNAFYGYLDSQFAGCTTLEMVENNDVENIVMKAFNGWSDETVWQAEIVSQTAHSLSEAIEYMKDNESTSFDHMSLAAEYIAYSNMTGPNSNYDPFEETDSELEELNVDTGGAAVEGDGDDTGAATEVIVDKCGLYYYNQIYDKNSKTWRYVFYSDKTPMAKIANSYWYNWRYNTLSQYNASQDRWVARDEEEDKNGASLFGTVYHICKQRNMYWQGLYQKQTFSMKKFADQLHFSNVILPPGNYYFEDGYDGYWLFTTDTTLRSSTDDSITYNTQTRWITIKRNNTETFIKTKTYSLYNVFYHPENIITQRAAPDGWIDTSTGEASDTWTDAENAKTKRCYIRTYFPVVPDCFYKAVCATNSISYLPQLVVHFYNAKQQWISSYNVTNTNTFYAPSNAYYVRIAEKAPYVNDTYYSVLKDSNANLSISYYSTIRDASYSRITFTYTYANTIVVEDMTYQRLPINEFPKDNYYIGLLDNMQEFLNLSDEVYITKYNEKIQAQKAADAFEKQLTSSLTHMYREGWWQDASYVDGDEERLYIDALDNLREVAKPEVSYNIEFLDLYSSNMGNKDFGASELTSDIDFPDLNITSAIHLVDDDLNLNCWAYVDKIKKCYDKPWLTSITVNTKLSTIEQHSFTDVMTHIADVASEMKGKMSKYDNASNKMLANFNVNYVQGLISEMDQTLKSSFKKIETIDGKMLTHETMIRQNAESISLEAARSYEEERSMRASLEITADGIRSRVDRVDEHVGEIANTYSDIKQTAEGIYGTFVNENNEQQIIASADEFREVFLNADDNQKQVLSKTIYGTLNTVTNGNTTSLIAQDAKSIIAQVEAYNVDTNNNKVINTNQISITDTGINVSSFGHLKIAAGGKFEVDTNYFDIDEYGKMSTSEAAINLATISNAFMHNANIWDCNIHGSLYNGDYQVLSTKDIVYQNDQPANPFVGMIWLKPVTGGGGGEQQQPAIIGTKTTFSREYNYGIRQTLVVNDFLYGTGVDVTLIPRQTRALYTITISSFIILNNTTGTKIPGGYIQYGLNHSDSDVVSWGTEIGTSSEMLNPNGGETGTRTNYTVRFTSDQWHAGVTDRMYLKIWTSPGDGNHNATYINYQNKFTVTVTAEVIAAT